MSPSVHIGPNNHFYSFKISNSSQIFSEQKEEMVMKYECSDTEEFKPINIFGMKGNDNQYTGFRF